MSLAAAAAPVFLTMSLLTECHRWVGARIEALLDETARGGADEMSLQSALGMSLMFTRGHGDAARDALQPGAIDCRSARRRGEPDAAARTAAYVSFPARRVPHARWSSRSAARRPPRSSTTRRPLRSPTASLASHCHSMGELPAARAGARSHPAPRALPRIAAARCIWASTTTTGPAWRSAGPLWMQGYPDQAIERVKRRRSRTRKRLGHPVTQTIVLHWAAAVYLWTGDLESAETHIDWFLSRAETHSLGPYLSVGRGLKGELAIHRGDARNGVAHARERVAEPACGSLRAGEHWRSVSRLARGLIATGRKDEGAKRHRREHSCGRSEWRRGLHAGASAREEPAGARNGADHHRRRSSWRAAQTARGWELRPQWTSLRTS